MTTNVVDVNLPLMSVAQIVHNGGKVVFAKGRCYIENRNGTTDQLEQREGLCIMKLWILQKQTTPFQGHA